MNLLASDRQARQLQLMVLLAVMAAVFSVAGLAAGSEGMSWQVLRDDWAAGQVSAVVGQIRAPRSVGALLVGALFGLAGAIAQGLFRNPLADPYLLGSAAGAVLGVVLVLAAGTLAGHVLSMVAASWLQRLGLTGAASLGALAGVCMTLLFARGTQHTMRLLLAGVVTSVVLSAVSDVVTLWAPDALRGKQVFLLGSTSYLSWPAVAMLAVGLAFALPMAIKLARALDALSLGEESAATLGLPLQRVRLVFVALLALCTGLAVSQAGLIAFVGLVAPHIVRRIAPSTHGFLLLASAACGAVLLLAADVLARIIISPQELPVGILTAALGGSYLLWLLHCGQVR
jgi:iron complex transport system permease protein